MNSMQSKCFNKLAAEYFVSSGCGFSFDPLIKKAAPLVTKKLAYSSTDFHGICSIFFEPSNGGKASGYNTFVAWGKNIQEIVDAIKKISQKVMLLPLRNVFFSNKYGIQKTKIGLVRLDGKKLENVE